MNPAELVLLGGGEHATVVVDVARSRPDLWRLAGYCNGASTPRMETAGLTWLGDDPALVPRGARLIVATGGLGVSNRRAELVRRFTVAGGPDWAPLVHATAYVSPTATIGAGALVCAGAVVNAGAVVGDHCIVNTGVIVEHDVRLGAFTMLGPGAVLGGGVTVGDGSFLGLGCRVRDHVQIGAGATVAMGAVVIGSVAAQGFVLGVPARPRT